MPAPARRAAGMRFLPSPLQISEFLLLKKALGLPLPEHEVKEGVDIYGADPDHLPIDIVVDDNHKWAYFFVEKKDDRRTTPGGHWVLAGDEEEIEAIVRGDNQTRAFKKYLVFRKGSPPDEQETDWEMEEYRINPDLEEIKNSNVQLKDYVVVRIYKHVPEPSEEFADNYEGSDNSDEDQSSEGSTVID